jgi:hypothetical protein
MKTEGYFLWYVVISYSKGEQAASRFRNEFLSALNLLKTENNEMHHHRHDYHPAFTG